MFGLPQQVGGAEFRIDRVIGDQHGLGRAGEQVDADAAVQLALGLGDIGVAGTDQHVDRGDGFGADGHRAHRLHAAQHIDLMRATQVHRGDDGGVRRTLDRRGRGDDAGHARNRRGQHRHMRRGHHRELATRHIAADRLHRNVAVAEDHAGQGFHLDIRHRRPLRLCKPANLGLGEPDILDVACGYLLQRCFNLGRCQAERRRRIMVVLRAQVAHRRIAACGDVGQHRFNRGAHACIVLGPFALGLAALEMGDGHCAFPSAQAVSRLPDVASNRWQAVAGRRIATAWPMSARYSLCALTATRAPPARTVTMVASPKSSIV